MRDLTRVVVHPTPSTVGFDSLCVPTYRASTITFKDAASYAGRSKRDLDSYSYGLYGTPTTRALEEQLSGLEGAVRTVLTPSGLSAITVIMMSILKPGDEVLIPDNVYPPVIAFCDNILRPLGIAHTIYDPLIGGDIKQLMSARTKLVWTESPGSTTMEVSDISGIVEAAHAGGALVGCDNTWATPLLFKPLVHGVDFSVQALSKYVGGHSDLLLGSISVSDLDLRSQLRHTMRMLGLGVSPDDAALAIRGIETMAVRLEYSGRIALSLAQQAAAHEAVQDVFHPSLSNCPGHEFWRRDFSGASGVFSILLQPEGEAHLDTALDLLETFVIGSSFGGTRSLVAPMAVTRSYRTDLVGRTILRLSIGLEDALDLHDDVAALLDSIESD